MARKRRSRKKATTWQDALKICSMTPAEAKVHGNCRWCGKGLPRNKDGSIHKTRRWCSAKCSDTFTRNHYWAWARKAALRRDKNRCTCGSTLKLQVHHIVPRRGQGYGTGCWNHLSNLLTQCHKCHVVLTNEQRRKKS